MTTTPQTIERILIDVGADKSVSALRYPAALPQAGGTLILAHGAGAGQDSRFMVETARGLAARGIETVTFNFVYIEQKRRLPDKPAVLESCYRAVIDAVAKRLKARGADPVRLAIGGKSMGGRIAAQVAAKSSAGLAGLVLLGYPLHPPGRPDKLRVSHLAAIRAPMLFMQGTRDTFGTPQELAPFLHSLAAPAELCPVEGGDHSFKVLKRAGPPQDEVDAFVLDTVAEWLRHLFQVRTGA